MSPVPLVGLALVAGLVVAVIRGRRRLAWIVGLGSLLAVAGVAVALRTGVGQLGGLPLAVTAYGHSLLVTVAAGATLVGLVAATAAAPPTVAAALLIGVAAVGTAVVVSDPLVGLWATLGGALAAIGLGLLAEGSIDRPGPSVDALRAVAVAGALGVLGVVLAAPPLASPAPDAGIVALAYIAVGVALGLRLAAVPLHGWAARLADTSPMAPLAASLVWLPVAFALVVVGWQLGPVTAAGIDLGPERTAAIVVGLATVALGTVAAFIQDDLGHATAYLVIADGGLALVAFGTSDASAWAAVQTWLLVLVASKTGALAWTAAIESAYATRRLPDIEGWARRSPGLGAGFVLVGLATVGWPGSAAMSARSDLAGLVLPGPAGTVLAIALLAVVLPYLRILLVGSRRPAGAVAAGPGSRPTRPGTWRAAEAAPFLDRARAAGRDALDLWSLNRRPVAAAAVVVLALLAVAVSAGALGTGSADAVPPGASPTPGLESPTPSASASASIGASPSASAGASPSAFASALASPGPASPAASISPSP